MQNNYTDDELIQYIYNELDPQDYKKIRNELEDNYELKKDLELYNKLIRHLNKLYENPSKTTIDMIMEYSGKKPSMSTSH